MRDRDYWNDQNKGPKETLFLLLFVTSWLLDSVPGIIPSKVPWGKEERTLYTLDLQCTEYTPQKTLNDIYYTVESLI